jgi:hypothetical protein
VDTGCDVLVLIARRLVLQFCFCGLISVFDCLRRCQTESSSGKFQFLKELREQWQEPLISSATAASGLSSSAWTALTLFLGLRH